MRACLLATAALATPSLLGAQPAPDRPLLVVLTETGEARDGLPVYTLHPAGDSLAAELVRGVAEVLLRVYRHEQEYLGRAEGTRPEPAYLLLSSQEGGFARYGFWLEDEKKEGVAYVDLHRNRPFSGRFGALDQLLPHELFHAVYHQLAPATRPPSSSQVHALGLRTDRRTALNEGFAEHFQAMAIEHPGAHPATRALARDSARFSAVRRDLDAYRRELTSRLALATRMRMGFPLWYSNAESVLRYTAVRENRYARSPEVPTRLMSDDPYAAYLMESILPGSADDPPGPLARLIRTEGVVSALMYRWATHPDLGGHYREPAFYERFGITTSAAEAGAGAASDPPSGWIAERVGPLENVYLKLLHVVYVHRVQGVLELVRGYRHTFPDEAPWVDEVVRAVFGTAAPAEPPAIWLANPAFRHGTTLFDQFRALPRVHTFELNAASTVELAAVPGVDPATASAVVEAAPFESLEELAEVPGVDAETVARFRRMEASFRESGQGGEESQGLSLSDILRGYVVRLAWVLALAAGLGALAYRRVRRAPGAPSPRWWRAGLAGLAVAILGAPAGWTADALLAGGALAGVAPALGALLAPALIFGVPAALWSLRRRGEGVGPGRAALAWVATALPVAVMVTPWF